MNHLSFSPSRRASFQRGFTLVEAMVGLLLGMLTVIAISQILAMAEGQKRETTSGNDAQVNGALAAFTIQRDAQMAGYGLSTIAAAMSCALRYGDDPAETMDMVPVRLTDGADGGPDAVTVLMSNSQSFAMPLKLTADHPQGEKFFKVQSTLGVSAGDVVVAIPAADMTKGCTVYTAVKDEPTGTGEKLDLVTIPHEKPLDNMEPTKGYGAEDFLVNVGSMAHRTYSLSDQGALQMETFSVKSRSVEIEELFPQIINLQAYYGLGDNSYTIDRPKDYTTVQTVRIAVVARSSERQPEEVTQAEPEWDLGQDATVTDPEAYDCKTSHKCLKLKVNFADAGSTEWKHYRYRVYDTVIPLRNVLWSAQKK